MTKERRHPAPTTSGIDLRGQLASSWLRRRPILAVAVLVGLAVFALQSWAAPVYATDTTIRINVQGEAGSQRSEAADFYAQTVVGVADTQALLETVVARSGLAISPDEAADRISVTETDIPGFLTVTASGPSPEASTTLAAATTSALALRLAQDEAASEQNATAPLREQIAAIETELVALPPDAPARASVEQRLTALIGAVTDIEARPTPELILGPPPVAAAEPVSPRPVSDALLAFLVALILAAEFVVVNRALRGRLSEVDPAAQIEHDMGVPTIEIGRSGDPAAALATLYRHRLQAESAVTVVQLARRSALDVGVLVAAGAGLVGDEMTTVEPTDDGARPDSPKRSVATIHAATVDADVLALVRAQPGVVVLAVATATAGSRQLSRDLAGLRAVGAEVTAVIVWHGRFPAADKTEKGRWMVGFRP